MARENLQQFLVDLCSDAKVQESFKSNPDQAMAAAGLNDEEQALVKAGNEDAIRQYLGDTFGPAGQIKICF